MDMKNRVGLRKLEQRLLNSKIITLEMNLTSGTTFSMQNMFHLDFLVLQSLSTQNLENRFLVHVNIWQQLISKSVILGRPGTDYPVLGSVPYTNFYCDEQPYPGFYADEETRCQTWHYCDIDGRQTTFLCPNGTQFSQMVFVCDWWFNVRCDLSSK